ncbi:MAG: hypothetical protein AAF570_08595, partial [Bacteroidota bacterium]
MNISTPLTNKPKALRTFAAMLILLLVASFSGFAQQQNNEPPSLANVEIPPSPDAAALTEYTEIPVSLYTGIPSISVPIWTLTGRESAVPVSFNYHAAGVRVDELASRVGLGWSLNAGGAISRTVLGQPDEAPNGYLQTINQLPTNFDPNDAQQYALVRDLAEGRKAAQPDAFSFSMPGNSGRLVFDENGNVHAIPYQKIKVEVDWNAKTWKITTADGMIYHFGGPAATEITSNTNTCGDFGSSGHISSWLLNKIEGPNGDEITFTYLSDGLIANTPQVSVTKYRPQIPGDDCSGKTPTSCTSTTFHNSLRPHKIESAFGRIEFIYGSQTRQDIPASRALERIEIWDSYNVRKKYFDLSQSYWSGRLMLDGVSEHGDVNTRKPAYQFTYDKSGLLPPQGSFSQDHWGFYNGKQNSELIPRTEISACVFVGSADRSPDFNYGKIGTLTNIQYPAGGSTTFQYEPHDQWAGPQNFPKTDDNSTISLSCAGGPNCGGGPTSQTQPFVIDHDQCVTINVNLSNPVQNPGDCEAKIRLWTSAGTLVEEFTCVNQANGQHLRFLSAGSYYLEAVVQVQGDAVQSGVFFKKQLSNPILNKQLGGLRVARITDHDAFDPANDIVREFVYRLENDPQRSSGILARAPRYVTTNEEAIAINPGGNPQNGTIYQYCTRIGVGSSNQAGGPATGGSHIGYREVTTLIGAGGSNGKTVSRFTNSDGFPDSQSAFPGGPGVSWDHRRGMLESQTTYDNTGKKVAEMVNEYAYATDNHTIVRGYSAGFQRKHPVNTGAPYEILVYQPHEVHSEWVYMSKTVSKQFDENGVDFLATTTDYEYGNPAHAQMTATRSTDSQGRELITRMQYPLDFAGGSGPYARALNKLANGKFMHAVPVEQTMSQKKPGQQEEVLQSYLW